MVVVAERALVFGLQKPSVVIRVVVVTLSFEFVRNHPFVVVDFLLSLAVTHPSKKLLTSEPKRTQIFCASGKFIFVRWHFGSVAV